MRGKKYRKLLTWLLCICMIVGMIPNSAFAVSAEQQSQNVTTSQEAKETSAESKDQTKESKNQTKESKDQKEDQEEADKSKKEEQSTKSENTTIKKTTEEKKTEEKTTADTKQTEEKSTQQNTSNKIATQALTGNKAEVSVVKLLDKKNHTVWGEGIITGSGDLDDKCWDGKTNTNRGYDDSSSNNIIRSFDSISYNVSTTIIMDGKKHTLKYEVTLPDDDELALDQSAMKADKISDPKKENGKKTYVCEYSIPSDYAGGEKEINIIVKVGNKHQGYQIEPDFKAYLDDDSSKAQTVNNMEPVTVTTAPMYNIVLKQKTENNPSRDIFDFNQKSTSETTYYPENAKDYKDNKVNGYERVYGFALEIKKDGKGGIKGVELPDPKEGFKFDIDLSDATLVKASDKTGSSMVEAGFNPLLYYVDKNRAGGGAVWNIPYTDPTSDGKGCYDSGKITMTQDGTTLHVTVKDFKVDTTKFPKSNLANESYWQDLNAILEGNFSAYQFHVIYPYINEKNENLQEKIGDGTINVKAEAKNMEGFSETGTKATTETSYDDNIQSSSWSLTSGSGRNQQIYYSKRTLWTDEYTTGKKWNDGDIAAAGTKDLAFTVAYEEGNVGEAYPTEDVPVAIDHMVLFDRNALDDVTFNRATTDTGYSCNVLYAVYKGGRLNNEDMKKVDLSDMSQFEFYTEKPEGGCDGVLLQYRGANTGKSKLDLLAQCYANVKADVDPEKVYMITAVTNSWTAKDLQDEILKGTGKQSLSELSHKEISEWVKKQDPTDFVKDKNHTPSTIDPRNLYTVPNYTNGVYDVGNDHKCDVHWADGLYIVPYTTTVTKTVAQLNDNGTPKDRYNVSKGQRFADYKISSSIRYGDNVTPPEDATTTVYLEDTLPKGLTYIEGSAYWGGNYTSKFPQAGVVNGGKQIEPEVTSGKNGTTILKWTIKNVKLQNGELPTLYYSCMIGDELHPEQDIADNENLKNTVTIQTDEDKRPINEKVNNIDTAAISVAREKEFYIVKRGGDSLELQDDSYYELIATNTSSNAKDDLWMFDTLPYKNDGKSTKMDGVYQITSLTMDQAAIKDATDIEVWYTDNEEYIGKTAKDITSPETTITEANGWKKASESRDGKTITFTGEGLINAWPTAIVYKDKTLESNTVASLKLSYKAVAGAENDNFTNTWSTMSNGKEIPSSVTTDVYKRSLEGTVWFDKNQDGKIDDNETKLEGVKVTLYIKDKDGNYKPYTPYDETVNGTTYKSPYTVETDENGHYKFSGLPSGEFHVEFTSSDGTKLGGYDVTEPNADKDITKTSKVEKDNTTKDKDGKLESGTITDIKMPTLEQLVSEKKTSYNLPDQNLGLTIPTREISVTKTWKDNDNQDGKRPKEVKVVLLANGKKTGKTLTLKADENWEGKFINLPKYDESNLKNLQEIKYSIEEVTDVDGYTSEVTGDAAKGFTVTNTHQTEKISIPVEKKWNDANDQDGKRPDKIIVHLQKDGKDTGDKLELTAANGWKGEFKDLVKYESGKVGEEINYTVREDNVEGYTTDSVEGDVTKGYTLTNKHTPETIDISGTKTWNDKDDQDGKRPESITVRLLANGSEVKTAKVTEKDNWEYTFKGLPKYENGTEITYTVTEDAVTDYTSDIKGFDVTNSYEPGKVSIPVTKSWNDANNQDGKRPTEVVVRLYANGKKTEQTLKLSEKSNWSGIFKDLDKYAAKHEITYTVKEETKTTGYTEEVTGDMSKGYTVTNTYQPETINIAGSKTWKDADDQDGKRPEKITIHLLGNNEEVASKDVTADTNWKYEFKDLAKYEAGKEIKYTIKEAEVEGYKTEINGYDVTNTYKPETVDIFGSKAWDDSNDQDGKRPEMITIHLLADGTEVASKEVTADTNWKYEFKDLAKYKDGKEIKYTIKEDKVEGYETEINGYDVTNTYKPETVDISGSKTWEDAKNQDGKRPEKITIHLLADNEEVDKQEVTADTNWKYEFKDLAKYKDGKEIKYTIKEDKVEGYETTIKGYNVTNTHNPSMISIPVTKTWNDANDQDGKRPEKIVVHLYANGIDTGKVLFLTEAGNWKGSFDDLAEYSNGEKITYTVQEENVENYTKEITGSAETGFEVTNTHNPEMTSISGSKTWDDANNQDGKRPDTITIRLLADGTEVESKEVTVADNWSYSFTNIPKYANGNEIVYTVTEDAVDDYSTTVNGYDVTNSYTPGKVSVTVTKAWEDANDQDGKRPEKITVHLYADGVDTGKSLTLTKADNWSGSFTELDEYKAGQKISYTIKEDAVNGYNSEIAGDMETGYVITNIHNPSTINVPVKKIWSDNNNKRKRRPDEVTIHLYADGVDTGKVLKLTKANNWKGSFLNLTEYKDGQKIKYTIKEDHVKGYAEVITGDVVNGYVVTNTYDPHSPDFPDEFAPPEHDGSDSSSSSSSSKNTKEKEEAGRKAAESRSAKTGDTNAMMEWMIVCAASFAAIVIIYKRKKYQNK